MPAVIVLTLLFLPFFDRKSSRAWSKRPVARWVLILSLVTSSLLLGAALGEPNPNQVVNEVGRSLNSIERSGRALYEAQGCGSCHLIAGRGGDRKENAPPLTDVGLRHSGAWLHSFIENPLRFHPDSKMPSYGPPTLSHQEIEELTRYLTTLRGIDLTKKPEYADTFPEPSKPKEK